MVQREKIRIGTRGSALALAQAEEVRQKLCDAHALHHEDFEICVISTAGDRIQDRPLSEVGGKGLFSKEIEAALLRRELDFAVHSTKDMASTLPEGLAITSYLEREDVRDAFLSPVCGSVQDLPRGAVVGSSSLRRQALLKRLRPDIEVVMFRGNVQTRLAKLDKGEVAATLLACAGLARLQLDHVITARLDVDEFPPAPGQGAICIESREDDERIRHMVSAISHEETALGIEAERAFLKALDGSCRTPIAGYSRRDGDMLHFSGMILSDDGQDVFESSASCPAQLPAARAMGDAEGKKLRQQAGDDFFHHWT